MAIPKNSDIRQKILLLLKSYTLSTREISEEIGATYATTLKYLEILHASSLIENKVYGKTKVWSLKRINPFDLEINNFLYLFSKTLWKESQNYQRLEEMLNAFYSNLVKLNEDNLKKLDNIELIKRYLELEKDMKWKDIEGYDIIENQNSNIQIKIFDCNYKFGYCANLFDENIKIFCVMGQKFLCLLNYMLKQPFHSDLKEFSIDPNFCIVQVNKSPT